MKKIAPYQIALYRCDYGPRERFKRGICVCRSRNQLAVCMLVTCGFCLAVSRWLGYVRIGERCQIGA